MSIILFIWGWQNIPECGGDKNVKMQNFEQGVDSFISILSRKGSEMTLYMQVGSKHYSISETRVQNMLNVNLNPTILCGLIIYMQPLS